MPSPSGTATGRRATRPPAIQPVVGGAEAASGAASSESAAMPVDAVRQPVGPAAPRSMASPGRFGRARLQGDPQGNREQVGGEDEHALTGDGVGPAGGDGEAGQLGGQRLQRVLGAEREQVVQAGRTVR